MEHSAISVYLKRKCLIRERFLRKSGGQTRTSGIETLEEEEELADDLELAAVITAAIAASEGVSPSGLVVRSIKRAAAGIGKKHKIRRIVIMKNYKITVNGNVYDVTVEETTGTAAAAAPARSQHLQQLNLQHRHQHRHQRKKHQKQQKVL